METLPVEIIAAIYPFSKLDKRSILKFIKLCRFEEYQNNTVIYNEGDPPDKMYLLLRGRLIATTGEAGFEIERIKRGTLFGVISLFNNEPHSVTVRTIEPCMVLEIDRDTFHKFLKKHSSLYFDFSRILSERVRKRSGRQKTIFKSLTIGISSFSEGLNDVVYMSDLAKELFALTHKKIIVAEFSINNSFGLDKILNLKECVPLSADEFSENEINKFITEKDFDHIRVKINEGKLEYLFPIINYISENYNFAFLKMPVLENMSIGSFLSHVDYFHILTKTDGENISSLDKAVKGLDPKSNDKLKRIVFLGQKDALLKYPVYHYISDEPEGRRYDAIIRKIARELGEKTLALVLGSGAAYGFAHIGVIKVLNRNKIPIDIVAGSSIGAFIGALWALGYSAERIEKTAVNFGRRVPFASFGAVSFPFKGLLKSKKFEWLLKGIFKNLTFKDLKYPLKIIVFDFMRRESKIINTGYLYKAVAASCSMPGIFEPIVSKEGIFLDGGILNPLPVDSVLGYAKKIISVNVTPSQAEILEMYNVHKSMSFNIFDFIFGSVETMQRRFIADAIKISDIVIHPDIKDLSWLAFNKAEEFIKRGEKEAESKLSEIESLVKN